MDTNKKICFVVSPISDEGTDIRKRSDQLLRHIIRPVCDALNYDVIRVDEITANDKIDQTIVDYLSSADLVIADLTDHNPNAFFELGYRSAKNLPVIQMALENTALPFDISSIRTIFYRLDDPDKLAETKDKLQKFIENIAESFTALDKVEQAPHPATTGDAILVQIIPILYQMQNSINGLYNAIENNNQALLKEIMKTSFNEIKNSQQIPDINAQMSETLLKAALNEPEKLINLMALIEKLPQK